LGVEVLDLAGDADRVVGGVERADRADPAVALDARPPERVLADPVGGDHAQASHHDPTHDATSFGRPRPRPWEGAGTSRSSRAGAPAGWRPRAPSKTGAPPADGQPSLPKLTILFKLSQFCGILQSPTLKRIRVGRTGCADRTRKSGTTGPIPV